MNDTLALEIGRLVIRCHELEAERAVLQEVIKKQDEKIRELENRADGS